MFSVITHYLCLIPDDGVLPVTRREDFYIDVSSAHTVGRRREFFRHYIQCHVQEVEVPFSCSLCGCRTYSQQSLNSHPGWYPKHNRLARKFPGMAEWIAIVSQTPYAFNFLTDVYQCSREDSVQHWQMRAKPDVAPKIVPEKNVSEVVSEESVTVQEEVMSEVVVSVAEEVVSEDQRKVEKREERVSEDVVLEEDSAEFEEEEEASNIKSNKRKRTESSSASSSASSDSEDHCNEVVKNGLEKVVSNVKSLNLDMPYYIRKLERKMDENNKLVIEQNVLLSQMLEELKKKAGHCDVR